MKQKPLLESQIQRQIIEYLQLKKIFHYKNITTGIYQQKTGHYIPSQSVGSPDIIAVIKGQYWGIEVKRPGNKLSPHQEAFRDNLQQAGGKYVTVFCLEDIMDII